METILEKEVCVVPFFNIFKEDAIENSKKIAQQVSERRMLPVYMYCSPNVLSFETANFLKAVFNAEGLEVKILQIKDTVKETFTERLLYDLNNFKIRQEGFPVFVCCKVEMKDNFKLDVEPGKCQFKIVKSK